MRKLINLCLINGIEAIDELKLDTTRQVEIFSLGFSTFFDANVINFWSNLLDETILLLLLLLITENI
jgi:hypothetical protein